jgi:hypothetical protein
MSFIKELYLFVSKTIALETFKFCVVDVPVFWKPVLLLICTSE